MHIKHDTLLGSILPSCIIYNMQPPRDQFQSVPVVKLMIEKILPVHVQGAKVRTGIASWNRMLQQHTTITSITANQISTQLKIHPAERIACAEVQCSLPRAVQQCSCYSPDLVGGGDGGCSCCCITLQLH